MSLPARLSRSAAQDLEAAWLFGAERWGVEEATRYEQAILSALNLLGDYPDIGHPVMIRGKSYRKLTTGSHQIFYQRRADDILVVRILHGSMDIDRHLA